jgi:hypothetical protein
MATIRVPTFRRGAKTAQAIDTAQAASDAGVSQTHPDCAGVRYVWLCVIIGAAVSIGIGAGLGLDHAGMTIGVASWLAGVIAFWAAFVPLMVVWAVMHIGRQ